MTNWIPGLRAQFHRLTKMAASQINVKDLDFNQVQVLRKRLVQTRFRSNQSELQLTSRQSNESEDEQFRTPRRCADFTNMRQDNAKAIKRWFGAEDPTGPTDSLTREIHQSIYRTSPPSPDQPRSQASAQVAGPVIQAQISQLWLMEIGKHHKEMPEGPLKKAIARKQGTQPEAILEKPLRPTWLEMLEERSRHIPGAIEELRGQHAHDPDRQTQTSFAQSAPADLFPSPSFALDSQRAALVNAPLLLDLSLASCSVSDLRPPVEQAEPVPLPMSELHPSTHALKKRAFARSLMLDAEPVSGYSLKLSQGSAYIDALKGSNTLKVSLRSLSCDHSSVGCVQSVSTKAARLLALDESLGHGPQQNYAY